MASLAALTAMGAEAGPMAFPGGNGTILVGSGGKLYSLTADGRRRALIRGVRTVDLGDQAAWSPDGTRIAFARRGGGISVADATGRHQRRVTRRGHEPAWSPDGSQVVFTQNAWLHLVRPDGRGLRRLFQGSDAQWSPDGTRIAFQFREGESGADSIFVSALDGSGRVVLKQGSSYVCGTFPPLQGSANYVAPAWAPDGSRIAYVFWLGCGTSFYASINAISPDRSESWSLVEGGYEGGPISPAWSPTGRALAYFEQYEDGFRRPGLRVLPLGGTARRIAPDGIPFDWRPVCGLRGSRRADRLKGSDRADLVCGFRGDDTITGGAGRDRLFGEDGADRFFAQDGEFDVVGCGKGRDAVEADSNDLVGLDCERVERR